MLKATDTLARRRKNLRQKFLGRWQDIERYAVFGHQQPSSKSLVKFVQPIAGANLHYHRGPYLSITTIHDSVAGNRKALNSCALILNNVLELVTVRLGLLSRFARRGIPSILSVPSRKRNNELSLKKHAGARSGST